jgi:hypothetical protein
MQIDYDSARLISKTMDFDGQTEDGKEFTITANWNDWDDWNATIEDISWKDRVGTEDEIEEILTGFHSHMNG